MTAGDSALRALLELTRPFVQERRGDLLGGALESITRALDCRYSICFAMRDRLELSSEHARVGRSGSWQADEALAERVVESAKTVCQTRELTFWDFPAGALPHVASAPIVLRRQALGALVVVADQDLAHARELIELFANTLGLAFEVDRAREREAELRAELMGAGRMASLGVLLRTLAHELEGPLNALSVQRDERRSLLGRLTVLAAERHQLAAIVGELVGLASEMDLAVARLGKTVSRILALGRNEAAPAVFDLSDPTRDALDLCRTDFARRGVMVSQTFEDGAGVRGRRDQLGQVVLNLLRNAADACEGFAAPRVLIQTSCEPNRVILTIEDNGSGITGSAAQKIFDAFYTTKPRGRGSGLGLKICRDIVSAHGGHIEVSSTPGAGATFRVFLPRVLETELLDEPEPARPGPRELTPTRPELKRVTIKKILLVDGDDILARALKRALKPHEVTIVSNAAEASTLLEQHDYEPDFVLCDAELSAASGLELHRQVLARDTELARRFVFMTSGAFGPEQSQYLRESEQPMLLKPVSVADVLALLAREEQGGAEHAPIPTLRADDG